MRISRDNPWCRSMSCALTVALIATSMKPWPVHAQTAVPGIPSTPTSAIVNESVMRPTKSAAVSLFNGTLAGWTGDSAWTIQDGALTGGNGGSLGTNSYLRSAGRYTNFDLRLKVKVPPQGNLNNGGIEFLTTSFKDSSGVNRLVNYQWDAGSGYWGTLFDEGSRFRQIRSAPVSPPKDGSDPHQTGYPAWAANAVRLNDWNDLRLVVEYPRIRGWVNGYLAIDFTETEPEIAKAVKAAIAANRGSPLALQAHAGSAVKVQYKDISITPLRDEELIPLGTPNLARVGRWLPPQDIGLIGVNAHLLPNGKVLLHDATQDDNVRPNKGTWLDEVNGTPRPSLVALYDPARNTLENQDEWFTSQAELELFCSGHTFLPNGNLVFQGNTQNGQVSANVWRATVIYDWKTSRWTRGADSTRAAYYPTLASTAAGDVLSFASGTPGNGKSRPLADHTEVYNYQSGQWRMLTNDAEWTALRNYFNGGSLVANGDPYYHVAMMPGTGKILHLGGPAHLVAADYAGNGGAQYYGKRDDIVRHWGSHQIYDAGKVLFAGGGSYSARYGSTGGAWDGARALSNTAVVVDMNNGWSRSPTWRMTGSMQEGRVRTSSSLMADGKVIMTGGHDWTVGDYWKDPAVEGGYSWNINKMRPEVWDPATGLWSEMQPQQRRRQYHSVTLLLPDGRILSAGSGMPEMYSAYGGYSGSVTWNDHTIEIFEPPYLFNDSGQYATRPTISWAPEGMGYGQDFSVVLGDTSDTISKLHLIKLSSQTHGVEMSSRLVPLSFTQSANYLDVKGLSDSTVAPAGHYMLIAVNDKGVPSVAKIVKIDNYLSVNLISKATGKALTQKDSALANGSAVGTATAALGALAQAWQMQFAEWTNGAYRLVSRNTGMALDFGVGANFQGFPLLKQQKPARDATPLRTQLFQIGALGNGEYKLETNGRSMDGYWQSSLFGGTSRDDIVSFPFDGRDNQRWHIYPTAAPVSLRLAASGGALGSNLKSLVSDGGSWVVRPSSSGGGKVNIQFDKDGLVLLGLDSTGALKAIPTWGSNPATSGVDWEFEFLPSGFVRMKNSQRGTALTGVNSGGLGTAQMAALDPGNPLQLWRLSN